MVDSAIIDSAIKTTKYRKDMSPFLNALPVQEYPEQKDSTWFEFLRRDWSFRKIMDRYRHYYIPFNFESLNEQEKKTAKLYYSTRLPIITLPMFLEDITDETKWTDDKHRDNRPRNNCTTVHYGQRKLLINEALFLIMYNLHKTIDFKLSLKNDLPPIDVPIVVYAGAGGTGTHLMYLARLFKGVVFHCYDASTFDPFLVDEVESKVLNNIVLYQNLFLDKHAEYYRDLENPLYFISDIRTATQKDNYEEKENKVLVDDKMQNNWVNIMNPIAASLKWRIPYTSSELKHFSPSIIMLQPWSPWDSSELRLIVERERGFNTMKLKTMEELTATLNFIIKPYAFYEHPIPCSGFNFYDKVIPSSGYGLCHCWSCTYELIVWCLYLKYDYRILRTSTDSTTLYNFMKKHKSKIIKLFNDNTRYVCRNMNINCHGMLPNMTTREKYEYFGDMNSKEKAEFVEKFTKRVGDEDNDEFQKLCFHKDQHTKQWISHFNERAKNLGRKIKTRKKHKNSYRKKNILKKSRKKYLKK